MQSCSAYNRYMREYAPMLQFFCHDDKHGTKYGEPRFLLAAVECRHEVVVSLDQSVIMTSHFSLIPSVCLDIDTPTNNVLYW